MPLVICGSIKNHNEFSFQKYGTLLCILVCRLSNRFFTDSFGRVQAPLLFLIAPILSSQRLAHGGTTSTPQPGPTLRRLTSTAMRATVPASSGCVYFRILPEGYSGCLSVNLHRGNRVPRCVSPKGATNPISRYSRPPDTTRSGMSRRGTVTPPVPLFKRTPTPADSLHFELALTEGGARWGRRATDCASLVNRYNTRLPLQRRAVEIKNFLIPRPVLRNWVKCTNKNNEEDELLPPLLVCGAAAAEIVREGCSIHYQLRICASWLHIWVRGGINRRSRHPRGRVVPVDDGTAATTAPKDAYLFGAVIGTFMVQLTLRRSVALSESSPTTNNGQTSAPALQYPGKWHRQEAL